MDWPSPADPGLTGQCASAVQYRNRIRQRSFFILAPTRSPRLRADSILSTDTFAQSVGS